MRKIFPHILALAAFVLTLWTLPSLWCQRGADDWFDGNASTQEQLARTVAEQIEHGVTAADFHTQSELFNGEWLYGTHLMAGIGLCQIVQQHPGQLKQWQPAIEQCIVQLLKPELRAFDRNSWKEDALESLDRNNGHAAYLGYMNFLLGLYREIDPSNKFTATNDAITAALVRRLDSSPNGLIATYPNEWYPMDNAPGLASIAMHGRATSHDYSELLAKQEAILRDHYTDPKTGLLYQSINADGSMRDVARGSGNTMAVYFLCRVYPKLGAEIFDALRKHLVSGVFNFGAIREYPHGTSGGGDIDSGPIIFNFGFSATGFGISNARAYKDRKLFASLYGSAILAGAPTRTDEKVDFLTAGPLGNAILLVMLTTPFAIE